MAFVGGSATECFNLFGRRRKPNRSCLHLQAGPGKAREDGH